MKKIKKRKAQKDSTLAILRKHAPKMGRLLPSEKKSKPVAAKVDYKKLYLEANKELLELRATLKQFNAELDSHRRDNSYRKVTAELTNLLSPAQIDAATIARCDPANYAINLLKIYQSKYALVDNPFR